MASKSAPSSAPGPRPAWASRIGVVLAVAGSAVGLGNFLRFPVQAAQNGGGAFMIPYVVAVLLLGIPLMWVEWALGRFGGRYSHGSAPGIFDAVSGRRGVFKYLGAIGLLGPLLIMFYYVFIESWTLGYAWFSLTGDLETLKTPEHFKAFLKGYQGLESNEYFNGIGPAYVFYLITFAANFGIVYLGLTRGIERVNKIAMPLLAVLGIILTIRVFTLSAPAAHPEWTVGAGMGFLWNPDFQALKNPTTWLKAAGQVLFTLSVGIGVILTYASYLKPKDDIALSGLTAAATNTFFEVIIGGSLVITAAVVFFGPADAVSIAQSGAFNLGFVTMPQIFSGMAAGPVFCFLWFALLFIAGVTSSISLLQPAVSFLEDEFHLTRRRAVAVTAWVCFLMSQLAIFGLKDGAVDILDFWGGTLALVVFALIELILFGWVFGIDRGWNELHLGAEIRIPAFYKGVIQYVTPTYVLIILGGFAYDQWGAAGATRLSIAVLLGGLCWLIHYSWKNHPKQEVPRQ